MKNIATVNTRLLVILVLAAGIVIRLVNYLNDPGLWLSEAQLSLNIIERSYSQLLLPLNENQVAPILFLWIEKTITLIFGQTELPLRFFPLLCSLVSLPLFYFVAGDLLKNKSAALIALFLFATAPIQIRYSAEVKQYISDVFVTLLLLWLYLQYLKGYRKSLVIQLSVAGMLSIFLSNIAVLVLFSIGIHWLYRSFLQKTFHPELFYIPFLWIISFGFYYYFFIAGHQNEPLMLRYWEGNFMPLNPLSGEFYEFLWIKAGKVLHQFTLFNSAGLPKLADSVFLAALLMLYILALVMMVIKKEGKLLFFVLFMLVLHLFLSGLKKYPFETRLVLYFSPLFYIALAYGMLQIIHFARDLFRSMWPGAILTLMVTAVFPYKLFVNYPVEIEGTRDAIYYINERHREGEQVYVYLFAQSLVDYYEVTGRVKWSDSIIRGTKKGKQANVRNDLAALEDLNGNHWLLFSHLYPRRREEMQIMMDELRKKHRIIDRFNSEITVVFLMEFKE